MELKLTAGREGRLSSFLTGELGLSTGLLNRRKRDDSIQVNGVHQWMDYRITPGDVITVRLDEEEPEYPEEDGPLSVIYEDAWLLAVEKPAGMLIHPSRARNTGTLANLVCGYYRRQGIASAFHPLTRLDRDTFGIVLLAKSAYVHTLLQQQGAKKTYHALVLGGPEEDCGVIDAPIARRPLPSLLREVSPEGKPCVTEYQVLQRREDLCLLALHPVTGRTHQLRVHCAYMGFPILGDPQYGVALTGERSRELGYTGQQLCARELTLTHPITGVPLCLQSHMDVSLPRAEG